MTHRRVHRDVHVGTIARRQALERLRRRRQASRRAGDQRSDRQERAARRAERCWDVQRGPPPVAYYVIGVVVAVFVMLGLVMVLSASSAIEFDRGQLPVPRASAGR